MKVRNGFVSNSSSSSFCIYGTAFDLSDLIEKVKELNLVSEEEIEKLNEDDYSAWVVEELISDKIDLSIHCDNENESIWIGKSWSSIEDNETGLEFKKSVEAELEKVFGSGLDYDTYDEIIEN